MFNSEIEMNTRLILLGHDRVEIADHWRQTDSRSTFWRLYVHDRDGARVSAGREDYPLRAGRVHLIPAWLTYSHATARPVTQFYAHFDLVRWTARVTNRLAPRPISLMFDPVMDAAWSAVRGHYDGGPGRSPATSMRVKALVHAALGAWLDRLDDGQTARALHAVAGRHEVEPALSYIENHLGEPIGNGDLAELCHYSTDHFAKVFSRVVGQTPGRYLAERRIAAAAQALAFTDRSIDDIAESLGFSSRFYFSRVFKRHLGTPPAAYRANQRVA